MMRCRHIKGVQMSTAHYHNALVDHAALEFFNFDFQVLCAKWDEEG